jgi:hypothetical protein
MKRCLAFLLASLLISCGGGGGDGGSGGTGATPSGSGGGVTGGSPGGGGTPGETPPTSGGSSGTLPGPGTWVQESDPAVTFSGGWTSTSSRGGYSGGSGVQSSVAGATATFKFTGTSVRWISARGRDMGYARVSVDGGPAKDVRLHADTGIVIGTPAVTIYDLSDGPHTLTIEVVSGSVVVDAFEVQPQTTVSLWQDTDPNLIFSAGWTKASIDEPWSGNGAKNDPELPVTAHETYVGGETVTLTFRGTGFNWRGYRGPDGGIALISIDGGAPLEVDTYSPTVKYQALVFSHAGLADTNHTLTITTTGGRSPLSSAARIVVDGMEVMTPGRRYENNDAAVAYGPGGWSRNHVDRVWSEGSAAVSNTLGSTVTFSFTGTSVSWIGCRKSSAGGRANVYIDGVLVREVNLSGVRYPLEGYQMPVFRIDGLANGAHTLTLEVTSPTGGSNVVVDAFDVHP